MKTVIVSVGGSLIVPRSIDVSFLKKLRLLVLRHKQIQFLFVTGGGSTARNYINSASKVTKLKTEDKDWLGIHATRLNAHLFKTIFHDLAYNRVLKNYKEIVKTNKRIIIASGWRPGHSTDYDAVQFALLYKNSVIVNLTNIDYVYNKDPNKYSAAKPLKDLLWKDYFKLMPKNWEPGMHVPFDIHASKLAAKNKLTVIQINGNKLNEFQKYLENKKFIGTVIRP
ncbi:UMP kinase [Candidatus Woesearchaeota archaeon]|nr:UMP kinase [Candidatus Woesearchaeota archaeon]